MFYHCCFALQLSRQDVEAFMQQRGCPALPDQVPEWQTPHLAKAPPEAEEDGDLDEEAAEAKMQEERLAVGEGGLVGHLAGVRTKRDHSPTDSQESGEPDSKKQKVRCLALHSSCSAITCVAIARSCSKSMSRIAARVGAVAAGCRPM